MTARLGVGVAGVVLPLGRVHHGGLGGVDAVGNDNTSSEEGPVRLQEGSVELLKGLNTEPRHDDGFRGYRGLIIENKCRQKLALVPTLGESSFLSLVTP